MVGYYASPGIIGHGTRSEFFRAEGDGGRCSAMAEAPWGGLGLARYLRSVSAEMQPISAAG